MNLEKKIIGIDPGLETTGWALIEEKNAIPKLSEYGYIKTNSQKSLEERLETIYDSIISLINRLKPDEAAIEEVFFTKKADTQSYTTHARGVILLALKKKNIKIYQYNPRTVKQNIAGNGNADKNQIKRVIQMVFRLKEFKNPDDMADAIAIALCHMRIGKFNQMIKTL